jgi:hypothetical protein
MPFYCTICGEESTRICVRCTKDTCANHLCDRCHRCSDCCECEVTLDEPVHDPVRAMMQAAAAQVPEPAVDLAAGPGPEPGAEPEALPEPESNPVSEPAAIVDGEPAGGPGAA